MLLKSTYMLLNNSAGETIENKKPSWWQQHILGKSLTPARWQPPLEAFTSSTLNILRWDQYSEVHSWSTQLVYKTDDPRNGIQITSFVGGPTDVVILGTHIHGEPYKGPVSRGIGLDIGSIKAMGNLKPNLGYEVLVHPGSSMTLYRVGFNVDWELGERCVCP